MRNLLILSFLFVCFAAKAQVFVNKVNINAQDVKYVEVWEKLDKDKNRFMGLLDYGQFDDRKNDKEGKLLRITNEAGIPIEFNGIVHILNYLDVNGWDILHVKAVDNYESYMMVRREATMQLSGADN